MFQSRTNRVPDIEDLYMGIYFLSYISQKKNDQIVDQSLITWLNIFFYVFIKMEI